MTLFKGIVAILAQVFKTLHEYLSTNELKKKWRERRAHYALKQKKRIDASNARKFVKSVDRMP